MSPLEEAAQGGISPQLRVARLGLALAFALARAASGEGANAALAFEDADNFIGEAKAQGYSEDDLK